MVANIIFDIILIAILIVGIVIGIKRGFLSTVAKPVKLAASFFVSIQASTFVGEKFIQPMISAPVTARLSAILNESYANITAATSDQLPTVIKLAAGLCGIKLDSVAADGTSESFIEAVIAAITDPVVSIAAVIIAFVAIFIVSMLVFTILIAIINRIIDNGLIGVMNKVLGCVFTFAFAFVIAWCFTAISDFVLHTPVFSGTAWVEEFGGGFMYNFFRSFSPIDLLLSF